MITFEKAIEKILKHTHRLPAITISLSESLGYVLAEKIKTKEPLPRFDSSAVDGYAVRIEDFNSDSKKSLTTLPVIGEVKSGDTIIPILRKGFAIKIFTGAVVPRNAAAVVMQENTKEKNHAVKILRKPRKGENIRRAGEEFVKGGTVIEQGTHITPPVIGLLASMGYTKIRVHRKPKVGLIVTGNELKSLNSKLRLGEIYDSNSDALSACLTSLGIKPLVVMRTKDNKKSIRLALSKAIQLSDVIISIGGVSVGEYDFVKEVLLELGVKKIFWKVAIKPGKPNFFGIKGKKLIFGLPGNPVAALVSFHQLVKPAINKLVGLENENKFVSTAKLQAALRKNQGRLEFVRGIFSRNSDGELIVTPTKGQDSHILSGLTNANCLINFPKDDNHLKKGSSVEVELLRW